MTRNIRTLGIALWAGMVVALALGSMDASGAVKTLLLADNYTKKIFTYDLATTSYGNEFADASGLLAGSTIRGVVANDAGTKVYVAVEDGSYNAAGARIYSYDVTLIGSTPTGTNPTLLYQHTLGNWGSRKSMTIGPDRNSDGMEDIYFTVPSPGWNNETVYWVDGVAGGAATSYQTIGTAHNSHLEFKSDGSLGWARAVVNNDLPRSWNSALVAVYGETGTLKYDANAANLKSGPNAWENLTDNSAWRIMDVDFGSDDVLYYSSYYDDTWNDRVYRRLYAATYNAGTGYWTPTAFTGGGLGDSTYAGGGTSATPPAPAGLQPGVMGFLTFEIPEPGTLALLAFSGALCMRRRRQAHDE